MQENGAWYWDLKDGKAHFTYSPTPQRQSIRDGNWHLLGFTYDAGKKEVWLYYDGKNVAIYNLEGISQVNRAANLVMNSGSHLDWTEATQNRHNGHIVEWPESKLLYAKGYRDSYRELKPDPVKYPAITHINIPMRIDYIYYKGKSLKPVDTYIIDKQDEYFPSDHAAVITEFVF